MSPRLTVIWETLWFLYCTYLVIYWCSFMEPMVALVTGASLSYPMVMASSQLYGQDLDKFARNITVVSLFIMLIGTLSHHPTFSGFGLGMFAICYLVCTPRSIAMALLIQKQYARR